MKHILFVAIAACYLLNAAETPAGPTFSAGLSLKVAPVAPSGCAGMALHFASGWYDGLRLELFATPRGFVPALEIGHPNGAWMLKVRDPLVPPGTWRHLAATWDGRIARLYVGGRVVAEGAYDGPWTPPKNKSTGRLDCGRGAFGLSHFPMETRAAFLTGEVLSGADIAARAGAEDPPDAAALGALRRLVCAATHLTLMPPTDGFAAFRTNWAARTVQPYGPAPVLPEGNAPLDPHGVRFHVAPDGDDAADGSAARPFRTLRRARDAIRALRAAKAFVANGVTVELADGVYPVTETLAFTARDGGSPQCPILWCAAAGAKPVLDGGRRITGFRPVTDPSVLGRLSPAAAKTVRVADVRAQGWSHFEPLPQYGMEVGEYTGMRPMTDVYQDGRRLELARAPDSDWFSCAGGNVTTGVMRVEMRDWTRWAGERELFYVGYPSALWADWAAPILALDPATKTIRLPRRPNGRSVRRFSKGYPFFLSNALAALDRPGEWYLDRADGLLYVWPLGAAEGDCVVTLPDFSDTFVTLTGVTDFEWRGIALRHGRGTAVVADGCTRVTFANANVSRFGNDAFRFAAAKNVTVRGCTLALFGHGGIRAEGGDRTTLTPAGIVIEDNDISFVEQWKRTYAPGLLLRGCGAHVRRNHFHDMRSSAMRLEGNDFLVASNLVEDVVLESDDQGGIDIYANPTYAIRIVGNVWRNIGRGGRTVACGQAGVRFDDAVSNMIVTGNRFENCGHGHFGAIQINGGRNNTIDGNLFVNCPRAVSIGGWKQERWTKYVNRPKVWPQMKSPLYRTRYPGIDTLPESAQTNRLWRNVVVGDGLLTGHAPSATDYRCNAVFEKMPTPAELAANPLWPAE